MLTLPARSGHPAATPPREEQVQGQRMILAQERQPRLGEPLIRVRPPVARSSRPAGRVVARTPHRCGDRTASAATTGGPEQQDKHHVGDNRDQPASSGRRGGDSKPPMTNTTAIGSRSPRCSDAWCEQGKGLDQLRHLVGLLG